MSIRISMIPVIERFSKSDRWSRSTYRHRRAQRQYIGSAHVEKSNDLIVALRQKHQGMHWSEPTSDALAALRTLMFNGGWDLYWQNHQVLPLAIPVEPRPSHRFGVLTKLLKKGKT